jgi:biopolymer transport protein ExbD
MRRMRRNSSGEDGIDISPLIDVVFILLIFFMVSTTFVKDAQLELQRPSAQSAEAADTKSVRISIDRQGAVYLGEEAIRLWMLQSRVREQLRASSQSSVLVIADRSTPTELLIDVVDQCRMGGAKDVGVITDKENG